MNLRNRLIRKRDLVANEVAFIDYRIPGCNPKHNYALIGPGVAQGTKQFINLTEPHGFNVGAVNVPNGVTNPPHLHFTAEVFICVRGDWAFMWGGEGVPAHSLPVGEGDIVSVPTWIYRGFKNVGADDGFLFTVLGRDDTGGILWAPSVVAAAQANGLYLTEDFRIIDTVVGEKLATDDKLFRPMSPEEIARLRRYTPAEMAERAVKFRDLAWSSRALLGAIESGVALAPVQGHGISEDRDHRAPIADASGFSIEWLRVAPGASVPRHRLGVKQVLIAKSGDWRVTVEGELFDLAQWDTYAMPPNVWRSIANSGSEEALMLVVTAGDGRATIDWSPETRERAAATGWTRDANGFCAPRRFVEATQR